jgi:trypsin
MSGARRRLLVGALIAIGAVSLVPGAAQAAAPDGWRLVGEPRPAASSEPPSQSPNYRVVGGVPTPIAKAPWQAALVADHDIYAGTDFDRQFCGASVIAPTVVLTAAHCITSFDPDLTASEIEVITGRAVLSVPGGQTFNAAAVFVSTIPNADVAAIQLAGGATASPRIKLAGPSERRLWQPRDRSLISGWGLTSEGGTRSDLLLAARLPIVSDAFCASPVAYDGVFLPALMLCAGPIAGGVGGCQGDSGGPLAVKARARKALKGGVAARWRLVGAVSGGAICGEPNKPTIFARVAAEPLRSAIQSLVGSLGGPLVIGAGGASPCDGKRGAKLRACKRNH